MPKISNSTLTMKHVFEFCSFYLSDFLYGMNEVNQEYETTEISEFVELGEQWTMDCLVKA